MKKIFIFVLIVFSFTIKAQTLVFESKYLTKKDTIECPAEKNKIVLSIKVTVDKLPVSDLVVKINDKNDNAAVEKFDYVLPENLDLTFNKESKEKDINIAILPKDSTENDESFTLNFVYKDYSDKEVIRKLFINLKKIETAVKNDNQDILFYNKLMILNAYSFDFNKEEIGKNGYVGQINILAPELSPKKDGGLMPVFKK